ncbi:MAG: glycosyl hydrolase 53 family protein [Clostridia bacterium]|nr:glycosyl hydrolase 53 family protein [Clostridia bacterium]
MKALTKKQKVLIGVLVPVSAIVLVLVIIMSVAVVRSKADRTVASGTLSMLGNLIRAKNSVKYETFDNQGLYADEDSYPVTDFRVSMSAMNHWEDGTDYADYDYTYSYTDPDGNEQTAGNLKELQQMFNLYGATEMYVRINTTRHYPDESVHDYYPARMHCLDESMKAVTTAVELGMPINVELGCFAAYSDAFESQAPIFDEYFEEELGIVYPKDASGNRKAWSAMSIEEICLVLKGYGRFVATQIRATGARVEVWDLGNETNYGFGGVMMPLKTSFSKATSKQFWVTYLKKNFGADWLAKNIWCYNGQMFAALKEGILEAYPETERASLKFSSHISTVTWGADYTVKYFKTLAANGYMVDQAGISYYPNATGVILDKISQIKQIVLAVNRELGVNVMLAEYGYANETGLASGTFASGNNEVHGYKLTDEDAAKFLSELITWGKKNGLAGIRPWAPELDWANPWFDFNNETKTATAKQALFDALKDAVK